MSRLIKKEDIPDTLFDSKKELLHLPPLLIDKWRALLTKNNLFEIALRSDMNAIEGGEGKDDTNSHLACRFSGSAARVMLATLDPKEELLQVSDVFAKVFSGNRVFLVDLPSGSGAATVSILTVFAELRRQGKVPRMPLEVIIVGGEISSPARTYFLDILHSLHDALLDQAIQIRFEAMDWNVRNKFSNTSLIKQITLKSQGCGAKLLVLANFSGFLQRDRGWDEATKQLDELFRHFSDSSSFAIWIEPQTNVVRNNFIKRLLEWFKKAYSDFIHSDGADAAETENMFSSAMVQHPLMAGKFRVHLTVVRLNLH